MTEHIVPHVPLSYRYFKASDTLIESDGRLYASDALCYTNEVTKEIPAGIYRALDEYTDSSLTEWTGVCFVLESAYADFSHLNIQQPTLEYEVRSSFGVDSGTAILCINTTLLRKSPDYDMMYDREDVAQGFTLWGWEGSTSLGDGAFKVEMIENSSHEIVGCRIDFGGIEKKDYYQMVADGIIEFDEEFLTHWFGDF